MVIRTFAYFKKLNNLFMIFCIIQIGFRTKCQNISRQNPTRHIYINIYCKVYKGWLEKKIQDIWKHIVRINSNIVFDISKYTDDCLTD